MLSLVSSATVPSSRTREDAEEDEDEEKEEDEDDEEERLDKKFSHLREELDLRIGPSSL